MIANSWREHVNVHSAADLFPMMPDDELEDLAADIEKHGLRQAIDFQGDQLLDGCNRLAAIHRIKEAPWRFRRGLMATAGIGALLDVTDFVTSL